MSGTRGSGIFVLVVQHDDDDFRDMKTKNFSADFRENKQIVQVILIRKNEADFLYSKIHRIPGGIFPVRYMGGGDLRVASSVPLEGIVLCT